MGNQGAKEKLDKPYTADELKVLEVAFRAASGNAEKLTKEKLVEHWSTIIDPHLAQCTANFLFTAIKTQSQPPTTITLGRFAEPFYIVDRGTVDEKFYFLLNTIASNNSDHFVLKEFEIYVTSVLRAFLNSQSDNADAAFSSWKEHGYNSADRTIQAYAKGLIRDLIPDSRQALDLHRLEQWLQINPIFLLIWRDVFASLYNKNAGKLPKIGTPITTTYILPFCEGVPSNTTYTPIIDIPHVIFVNSNLPNQHRNKWRFLFSSKIMGESFSTMLGKILKQGPTLIIVEDEDHYIFAGYASETWTLKPVFVGDDSSVLLTLSPAMRCFNATGYNDHYQYLNINQHTLPNGLGMGGQFNYWGLWIDREYGSGQSSETCTTYRDYVQLSKRKDFRIRNLEVWGIGDVPRLGDDSDEEGSDQRAPTSVLNSHLADRVMLELAGKKMHSDGLREPDMDT